MVALKRPAGGAPSVLSSGFAAAFVYIGADGGRLYFVTSLDAPNGRVVALIPEHPADSLWQEAIPEGKGAIDLSVGGKSVTLGGHQLLVKTLHDAHSRVISYDLTGKKLREVAFPAPGSVAGFDGHAADEETFYSFASVITPSTIYRYDLKTGESRVYHAPKVAFDPNAFEQRQVFYPGKDGTRIPMLLAFRKGVKLDSGANPVLLYGYGGFGLSMLPTFNAARIAWLERGGVFAMANIRGGGEYGEAWHRQGMLTHKQVVFDDFIAAGEWLVSQHYTSRQRLAIYGGSNGGPRVGAR